MPSKYRMCFTKKKIYSIFMLNRVLYKNPQRTILSLLLMENEQKIII